MALSHNYKFISVVDSKKYIFYHNFVDENFEILRAFPALWGLSIEIWINSTNIRLRAFL